METVKMTLERLQNFQFATNATIEHHYTLINNYYQMWQNQEIDFDDLLSFFKGIIAQNLLEVEPNFAPEHCKECEFSYNNLLMSLIRQFAGNVFREDEVTHRINLEIKDEDKFVAKEDE